MVRFDKLFKKLLSMIPIQNNHRKLNKKWHTVQYAFDHLQNLEKVENLLQNIIMAIRREYCTSESSVPLLFLLGQLLNPYKKYLHMSISIFPITYISRAQLHT